MKLQQFRFKSGQVFTVLLAIFYLSFAGGVGLLHHHPIGKSHARDTQHSLHFPPSETGRFAPSSAQPSVSDPFCIACYWSQNGQITLPPAVVPHLREPLRTADGDLPFPLSGSVLLSPSARAPPLG
ncbi:MAG: hypothetical protein KY468_07365 [Armatimonadetes bacterium]|nr:hypothetical protein [Armatimonadota bacterium]